MEEESAGWIIFHFSIRRTEFLSSRRFGEGFFFPKQPEGGIFFPIICLSIKAQGGIFFPFQDWWEGLFFPQLLGGRDFFS